MSSIRRSAHWVLVVTVMVAGMLLAAGSTEATAGPNYAKPPIFTYSPGLADSRIPSGNAAHMTLDHPCWGHGDTSSCSGDSDPPNYDRHDDHRWRPPTYIYIPPTRDIPPMPSYQPCQATVPNLINRTEDQARQALVAVGLGLGSDHPGNNRVISQVPAAGSRVLCGWLITVTVDQPPPPSPVQLPAADPSPALVVPPLVVPPAAPTSRVEPFPWFWPVVIALLLLSAALLLGLLLLLGTQARKGRKWVRAHVRAVVGAAPPAGVEVLESRTDHSAPPCVVRLESHADSGLQVLEEVGR